MRSTNPPLRANPIEKNASWRALALGGTSFKFGSALGFALRICNSRPVGSPLYIPWPTPGPTSQPEETNTCLICSAKRQPSRSPKMQFIAMGILGMFSKASVSVFRCCSESERGCTACRRCNNSRSALAVFSCCWLNSISTRCWAALASAASFWRPATFPFSVVRSLSNCFAVLLAWAASFPASAIRASASAWMASWTLLPDFSTSQVITAMSKAVNTSTAMYTVNKRVWRLVAASMGFEDWIVAIAILILAIGAVIIGILGGWPSMRAKALQRNSVP